MRHAIEIGSGSMRYTASIMTISSGIQAILRLLPKKLRGCSVGITKGGRSMKFCHCDSFMWHDIHTKCHEDW
jgi:hypothetical protein